MASFSESLNPVFLIAGSNDMSCDMVPVSYTHLDVYKRQALDAGDVMVL